MKNYLLKIVCLLFAVGSMAQSTVKVVVGNGGIFNNPADHVSITGIDPLDYSSTFIGEVIRESIQDLIVVESTAFIAAEDSIVKFDLSTNTKLLAIYQSNLSRLFAADGQLFVSLRTDLNGPPADGIYLKAFDLELNELFSTNEITTDAAGICKAGSKVEPLSKTWKNLESKFCLLKIVPPTKFKLLLSFKI